VTPAGRLLVGCSGWNYRDWRGAVYPDGLPARRWLAYYASRFDTVELNSTFYRLPSEGTVTAWAASVSPGFVFAMKLGAFGSHRMKLRDASTWLPNHVERAVLLGDHLGPTLVQLPPRWKRNSDRLEEFLAATPTGLRWAVELRDRSWLHEDTFSVLRRHGAALCLHDLLDDHPVLLTAPWTYIRFHGPHAVAEPYRGRYGARRLRPWAERIAGWIAAGLDVYAYFNNDVDASAVDDAQRLRGFVMSTIEDATRA
jgi:uncharacterized protein YecE (DUF72 family)